MKKLSAMGIVLSFVGTACAPVASSVPKLVQQMPSKGDTVSSDIGRFDIRVETSVEVISKDEYESFEKNLDSDYQLIKYSGSDRKLSDFRETRTLNDIAISPKIDRADIRVIFIVNAETVSAEKAKEIRLEWLRGEKGLLSMSVSEKSVSSQAWAVVKKKPHAIVIAYREAVSKKSEK